MEKYKNLFVPGAILGAGAFIAISLFATGGLNIPVQQGTPTPAENQGEKHSLGPELYEKLAKDMGVNISQFNDCVEKRTYKEKVENDLQEGIRVGVSGTPGGFVNRTPVRGALPYEQLRSLIEAELASGNRALFEGLNIGENDHVLGNPSAPITLVEFSDFQCPFCRQFHPTAQQALVTYGDQLRWVYKHFPLDQIHPQARPAAEASECIAEQKGNDGFWKFANALFELQGK